MKSEHSETYRVFRSVVLSVCRYRDEMQFRKRLALILAVDERSLSRTQSNLKCTHVILYTCTHSQTHGGISLGSQCSANDSLQSRVCCCEVVRAFVSVLCLQSLLFVTEFTCVTAVYSLHSFYEYFASRWWRPVDLENFFVSEEWCAGYEHSLATLLTSRRAFGPFHWTSLIFSRVLSFWMLKKKKEPGFLR